MSGAAAPFMEPRTARPPGLSPLDPARWVAHEPDFAAQMAARERLIDAPGARLALPEAADAVSEFGETLLAHLSARRGWRVGRRTVTRPDGLVVAREADALRLAGRTTQEDWLILLPGEPEARLVAGVLLFPSRWRLDEKLGRPLTAVHRPVPGYAEGLAPRVNRVFAGLRAGRPLVRANWTVHAGNRLDQPRSEDAPPAAFDPEAELWLRSERQTLLRLPRTHAIVFGVKTRLTPLAALAQDAQAALASALEALGPSEVAYRGGEALRAAALSALRADRPARDVDGRRADPATPLSRGRPAAAYRP